MTHKPVPATCSQCGGPIPNIVTGCRMTNVLCKACYGEQYYNRTGSSWLDVAYSRRDNIRDIEIDPERMEITGGEQG